MGKSTFHISTINISNGFFSQLNYIKMRVSMRINLLFVRLYLSNARMIDGNPVYCSLFLVTRALARVIISRICSFPYVHTLLNIHFCSLSIYVKVKLKHIISSRAQKISFYNNLFSTLNENIYIASTKLNYMHYCYYSTKTTFFLQHFIFCALHINNSNLFIFAARK